MKLVRKATGDVVECYGVVRDEHICATMGVFYDDAKSVWIKKDNYRAKAALVHLLSTFLYYNIIVRRVFCSFPDWDTFTDNLFKSHFNITIS